MHRSLLRPALVGLQRAKSGLRQVGLTADSRSATATTVIRGKYKTFNRFVFDESVHNLRDVRDRNASVKKVIGFDQNRHAGCALIETARCADARLELGESTRGNLPFQHSIHFF